MKNNEFLKLIPVYRDDLLEKHGIPFTQKTLRKWHSMGRNKELFVKIERRIFVIYAEWLKFMERNYKDNMERKSAEEHIAAAMAH